MMELTDMMEDKSDASPSEPSTDDKSLPVDEVYELFAQTKASLEVLTELVCLLYAKEDQETYERTLQAIRMRQSHARDLIIDALKEEGASTIHDLHGRWDEHKNPPPPPAGHSESSD